jgi:glycosyltransferase involved in cell wall biosynthesis
MKKKILILCDLFPPAFGPRMGYLCKYLVRAGWEPVVLTEAVEDDTFASLAGACPVGYITYYKSGGRLGRLGWLAVFALDLLFGYKDYRMYREACKRINRIGFDAILCSACRDFPLEAARRAARKYGLPFVADVRDAIEQYASDEYITRKAPFGLHKLLVPILRRRILARRNRALKEAACVTTISPWHVQLLRTYNPSVELIYNGYDPELFFPAPSAAGQFIITYAGRLLSVAMRDPSLLFEAIDMLAREGDFPPCTCRVRWYVDAASEKIVAALAAKAGVEAYMDFMGYIPASAIPAALNESSVLLLLANKASAAGPKGIMTTKVFEYLAVEKPILCVRSDESYLAELLSASQAGLAAREAGETRDFLRHYYLQWKENGYTSAAVDREATRMFSRENQAGQFMHIFERIS